ncbi:MAG: metallophosphoesterase [Candidatus Hydrogenedentes bacterium]|nr:metallophosphoesterase [Candidatus Hydrogenedentota bacterium]
MLPRTGPDGRSREKTLNTTNAARLALAALCIAIAGCATHPHAHIEHNVATDAKPWTSLDLNNDPDQFHFAIVTDRTGGARPGIFESAVDKINLLQPEFVMSIGDLIEGDRTNTAQVDAEWAEFKEIVGKLEMPFFHVPGNHDMKSDMMVEEWRRRFGPIYYHFRYRDVLFLCLNTEDPPASHMSDAQVEYVRKALDENKDVRWTLVFMHKPLWDYEDTAGWEKIEPLLQGRPHTVFTGHRHNYMKFERHSHKYFVFATTGGSSKLRGVAAGEFDHVIWVTMMNDGPRIANLLLDGILDENVRVAPAK